MSLSIPLTTVNGGAAFAGTVGIEGARPGATVSVSLRQVQGAGSWSGGAKVTADHLGAGFAAFPAIVLSGIPGGTDIATLVADASDDAGDFFWSSSTSVQVI
ncbi:MAG TPA: hypothetical protein VNG33_18605 [Polyangiaceae bacterium]|nr:hypothetical protein [Polyangiaceae bacterium]